MTNLESTSKGQMPDPFTLLHPRAGFNAGQDIPAEDEPNCQYISAFIYLSTASESGIPHCMGGILPLLLWTDYLGNGQAYCSSQLVSALMQKNISLPSGSRRSISKAPQGIPGRLSHLGCQLQSHLQPIDDGFTSAVQQNVVKCFTEIGCSCIGLVHYTFDLHVPLPDLDRTSRRSACIMLIAFIVFLIHIGLGLSPLHLQFFPTLHN